ncbi:hypothetical protein AB205_0096840, partial [Aquarana catesbeiana]
MLSRLNVMEKVNQTSPERFILLGLGSNFPYLQIIYFIVFLVMYIITLSGNLLLIIVVRINPKLNNPMYFFLSNLSIIDACFSSTIVPKVLKNTLAIDKKRFILLGLSNVPYLQAICFLVFIVMYIITLSGNFLLIIVVRINPKLQTPMCSFLSNLSIIDICFSSTIVPKILINTL